VEHTKHIFISFLNRVCYKFRSHPLWVTFFIYICIMIKVIHKKNTNKYENVLYIGRGSDLGNPYTSIQGRETKAEYVVSSREESIESFRGYLIKCIEEKEEKVCSMMNQIYTLATKGDVYLACYCKPKSCHGDVIKEIVESKFPEETDNQLDLFNKD